MSETIFKYTCPVFASPDVERDIKWYDEKMGFKNVFSSADYNKGDVPIDYAVLRRQNHFIHLQFHFGTKEDPVYGSVAKIEVENIRPLFEEFVKRGTVKRTAFRENTPWGTNEFGFYDLNNNAIFFLENVEKAS